jgi:hypothetical protein
MFATAVLLFFKFFPAAHLMRVIRQSPWQPRPRPRRPLPPPPMATTNSHLDRDMSNNPTTQQDAAWSVVVAVGARDATCLKPGMFSFLSYFFTHYYHRTAQWLEMGLGMFFFNYSCLIYLLTMFVDIKIIVNDNTGEHEEAPNDGPGLYHCLGPR